MRGRRVLPVCQSRWVRGVVCIAAISLGCAPQAGAAVRTPVAGVLPTTAECADAGSTAQPSFAVWPQVVVIAFENKDATYRQASGKTDFLGVVGNPSAPYITQLAADCGHVVNYHAIQYPSLPNYLAATGGSVPAYIADNGTGYRGRDCTWAPTQTANQCHVAAASSPSIFQGLGQAGWQSFQESMTRVCEYGNDANDLYVQRHNPATYYDVLNGVGAGSTLECPGGTLAATGTTYTAQDIPFPVGTPASSLTWISPNLCDDGHSSLSRCWSKTQIANADHFLQGFLPGLIQSQAYQSGQMVIFLWWDSDAHPPTNSTNGGPNLVPLIVLSKTTPAGSTFTGQLAGACSPIGNCTQYPPNHYSFLRTLQDMLSTTQPTYLGHAGDPGQIDLRRAFGLCNTGVVDGCG